MKTEQPLRNVDYEEVSWLPGAAEATVGRKSCTEVDDKPVAAAVGKEVERGCVVRWC